MSLEVRTTEASLPAAPVAETSGIRIKRRSVGAMRCEQECGMLVLGGEGGVECMRDSRRGDDNARRAGFRYGGVWR